MNTREQFRADFILQVLKNGMSIPVAVDEAKVAEEYVFGAACIPRAVEWTFRPIKTSDWMWMEG